MINRNNNPYSVSLQKWQRKQYNQADRIDILIIMESCIVTKNRFETNKQSFHRNVPNQWLITEQIKIIDLMLDSVDTISENGRNIYEWNQINQTILEIDFDWTFWNGRAQSVGNLTFWRFGISKYDQYSIFRNTFQCHWTRTTKTISFRINGFKLRQIYWNHFVSHQSYLSLLTNMNHHIFQQVHPNRV